MILGREVLAYEELFCCGKVELEGVICYGYLLEADDPLANGDCYAIFIAVPRLARCYV